MSTMTHHGGDIGQPQQQHNKSGQKFEFPLLKLPEILQCLSELGFDVTKEELTDPKSHREKLKQLWTNILLVCRGLSLEEDLQGTVAASVKAQVQERLFANSVANNAATTNTAALHQDFGDLFLFEAVQEMLKIVGYDWFSWRDLYAPTPKRLRHQLSAVINMAKFREEQLSVYTDLMEVRYEHVKALQEVKVEHENLQQQMMEAQATSEEREGEKDEIDQECQELASEIARNNKLQSAARKETNLLKARAKKLKEELSSAQYLLDAAQEEEERLRSLVVSSPQRRRQEWDDAAARLDQERAAVAAVQDELQRCKAAIRNVRQATKDVAAMDSDWTELQEDLQDHTKVTQQWQETVDEVKVQDKKCTETLERVDELERGTHRLEEQMMAQRQQQHMHLRATQEALEEAKGQLLQVEKDRRAGMMRVQEGQAEVQALQAAVEAERVKTAKEVRHMMQTYKSLERTFIERTTRHMQSMNAASRRAEVPTASS